MKTILSGICFTALCQFSIAQTDPIEQSLLELNGSKALYELKQAGHESANYSSLSWYLAGNEEEQLTYARQWADAATADKQAALANLYFARQLWQEAVEAYEEVNNKSILDIYRHIVATNRSRGSAESKRQLIEKLLSDSQLASLPTLQLELAEAYGNEKKTERAIAILNDLKHSPHLYIRLQALQKLARLQLTNNAPDSAFLLAEKAFALNAEVKNKKGLANCLYLQSVVKARQGAFEEAKQMAVEGAYLAREAGNRSLEYSLNNIKSWTYFETGENFNVVLENEARQVQLVSFINNKSRKADVYNNLGYDLTVAGSVHLDSAIALMQFANDTYAENEGHQGRWYTLMNLVWQYRLKGDYEKSAHYANLSVKQALSSNDRHAIIEACFQFGETLIVMGNTNSAGDYYQTGLEWRGDAQDRDSYVFDVYYANYLWVTGQRETAVKRLEEAVQFLSGSEVFYEMHGRALLAKFYFELQEFEKTEQQLEAIAKPRGDYFSLEAKTIAASTEAQLLKKTNRTEMANNLIYSYFTQAEYTGALYLTQILPAIIN